VSTRRLSSIWLSWIFAAALVLANGVCAAERAMAAGWPERTVRVTGEFAAILDEQHEHGIKPVR
jgi:hypothetical protein